MRHGGSSVIQRNVRVTCLSRDLLMVGVETFRQQGSPFTGQTPVTDDGILEARQEPEIERPICRIGGYAAGTADSTAEEHRDRHLDK